MTDLRDQLQASLGSAYAIERELGGGGMSRVFLAEERALRRRVVIKVLPPELSAAVSAERFRREVQVAARLQHPHVVPLLSTGDAGGMLYYTMPYVDGESLRGRLTREGALPVPDAVRLLREVADALACAHDAGVVHRDIKPENILLSHGHAVVTDFGVAKALSAAGTAGPLTSVGVALGTPAYMAPEQVAADPDADHRVDIYALGVLAHELLAGEPPFVGDPSAVLAAHLSKDPAPITSRRADVPPALAALVARCLAKPPDDRPASAAAAVRDLRAVEGGLSAGGVGSERGRTRTAARDVLKRRPMVAMGSVLAVVVVVAALAMRGGEGDETLDADLVAVAPFDVLDPSLQLWREGLVDVLARKLDGAGSLRTVSPTVVVRRWAGRADPTAAATLGRHTGARLAVFGNVIASGDDSVVIAASILDVPERRIVGGEVEVRGPTSRMDRLTDSLAVALLRELGRARRLGGTAAGDVRVASLRTSSLPALRSFLQGEQQLRRGAWDSAVVSFERAIAIDSGFALAWRRAGNARWWQITEQANDSLIAAYLARAARLNRGLPLRDSLLIAADSQQSAQNAARRYTPAEAKRWVATLELLVDRYPDDPEAWYWLGEARYHRSHDVAPLPRALDAFERSFALDPAWAWVFEHLIELALRYRGQEVARQYAERAVALSPMSPDAVGALLSLELLYAREPRAAVIAAALDTMDGAAVRSMYAVTSVATDDRESAVRVARAAKRRRDLNWLHPLWLSQTLARRGHLRASASAVPNLPARSHALQLFAEQASLTGVPHARLATSYRGLAQGEPLHARIVMLQWWGAHGDTAALAEYLRMADTTRAPADPRADLGAFSSFQEFGTRMARGLVALARGDTATAVVQFAALPDSGCVLSCRLHRVTAARVLGAAGRLREAEHILERLTPSLYPTRGTASDAVWELERARVAERLGNRARAVEAYRFVAEVWRRADPELRRYVDEAHAGLKRLRAN